MHKKYRKIVKKAHKQDFDLDKLVDYQRSKFGHIESKTSATKLFPPIGNRSKTTLNTRKQSLSPAPFLNEESIDKQESI